MKTLSSVCLLIMSLMLAGCLQTVAQRQVASINQVWAKADQNSQECGARVKSGEAYSNVSTWRITGDADPNAFEKKLSKSYLTADQEKSFVSYVNLASQCASDYRAAISAVSRNHLLARESYDQRSDNLAIQLVNRDLNIGEYNIKLMEAWTNYKKEFDAATNALNSNLEASHQDEMAERRRIDNAFGNAMRGMRQTRPSYSEGAGYDSNSFEEDYYNQKMRECARIGKLANAYGQCVP
jgi:hypothetical protein